MLHLLALIAVGIGQPLSLSASVEKSVFHPGEEVRLSLRLVNDGDNAAVYSAIGYRIYPNASLSVRLYDANGNLLKPDFQDMVQVGGNDKVHAKQFPVIASKSSREVYTARFNKLWSERYPSLK